MPSDWKPNTHCAFDGIAYLEHTKCSYCGILSGPKHYMLTSPCPDCVAHAEHRAKREPSGKRLPQAQARDRNLLIRRDYEQGVTQEDLAVRYDLHDTHIRRILRSVGAKRTTPVKTRKPAHVKL